MFSSLYFLIAFGSYIHSINAILTCTSPPDPGGKSTTVLENATVGHTVFTYAATYTDGSNYVFYRVPSTDHFAFNGKLLTVAVPLDFETKQQHIVYDVFARYPGTSIGWGRCGPLTVDVLPVNEFPPVFNPSLLIVNVSEGLPQNTLIALLNCTDEDKEPIGNPEGCSKISIQSGDDTNPRFAITNDTVVTTNNVIDYDTGDVTFTLIIVGIDSSTLDLQKTESMTLIINIDPVNEFTPSFKDLPLLTSIQETTPLGNDILRVTATDNDTGPHGDVTYQITGGNTDGTFLISQTSGKMYLRRSLDFDSASGTVYYLTLEASDGELTSTVVVNVTITDVNDNIPQCTPIEFNVTIDEDLPIGSKITTISCTDNDKGTLFTYQILSGDKGYFQMTSSGDLIVDKELPYDDGISSSFYMKIQISDGLHDTAVWALVRLNSVNEYPPTVINPTISVSELMDVGHEVMTYVADDRDAPPHHITSYRKMDVKNGDWNTIHVDKNTGKIFLTSKLDYEKNSQFKIIIKVTDGGGLSATGTVTVNVINDNNHPPVCMKTDEIITVPENTATGKEIPTNFECTDRDQNPLTFFLTINPDDSAFLIDSVTGKLKVIGLVDYETTPFYSMVITVSDGQLSTEITINANILNVNDNFPEFKNRDVSGTVTEVDEPGTYVARVSASDEDKDPVIYSFVGIYPEFMIDPIEGTIKLRTMVDRENSNLVVIFVQASDGEKSSTATVTVTINDINEEPIFEKTLYEFYIDENDLPGRTIGKVSAVDSDGQSQNKEVRYTIRSGIGKSYVKINASSGMLTLDATVDFERQKAVTFVAQASDSGAPPLSSFCTVIVHIRDENDNVPTFLSPRLFETISEDTVSGVILTRVVATDMDSTANNNNMIFYQSASSVPFAVDQLTGDVTVTGQLDRETLAGYEMIITATDSGSPRLTGTLTIDIDITDINDNDPIVRGQYIKTLPENVPVNFEVFRIIADDPDEDANGKLKYEILSSGMNSIFTMEENTGSLQIASPLDRESCARYDVIIRVSDNGTPPRSTIVTAIIYLSDINDMAPNSTKPIYEFSVSENALTGQTVGIISATDKDSGFNSLVTYTIATYWRGIFPRFEIDSKTGKIYTTGKLDREMEDEYSLLIRAKDSGTPYLWSDVKVNIKIEDVNDNQPKFRHSEFSTSIFENLTIGTNFLSTGAIDVDLGDNAVITYELDMSTQNGRLADYYFGVHRNTGNVFLSRSIDREVYQSFAFNVIARDNGIPSLWNFAKVQVNIDDVNDNVPEFSPVFYNTEASSINLCDAVLTIVTASDADLGRNAAINYELNKNDASVPFSISHFGAVTANQDLLQSKYVIGVKAYDNGSPVLSSRDHAQIRIDRFEPDRVILTFYMDIPMSNYVSTEPALLRHIQESLSVQHPKGYVKRWCIEESEYLLVHIYAVKNGETNDPKNINIDKSFLTNGQVLDNLQLDQSKRPTVNVNGKAWNHYGIKKVTQYGKETVYPETSFSGLSDSTSDLAIPMGVSLTILALVVLTTIIVLYIAWKRRWFRQSEKKTSGKRKFTSEKTKTVEEVSTPNLKESMRAKNSVSKESMLYSDIHDRWQQSSTGNPEKGSVPGIYLRQPPMLINDQEMEAKSSPVSLRMSHRRGATSPANVRKRDIDTKNRGVDIVTGWMYEEDPMTKVRKWIK